MTHRLREDSYVKTQDLGNTETQAKEHMETPDWERKGSIPLYRAFRESRDLLAPWFRTLVSRTVRGYISVVLSYEVCDDLVAGVERAAPGKEYTQLRIFSWVPFPLRINSKLLVWSLTTAQTQSMPHYHPSPCHTTHDSGFLSFLEHSKLSCLRAFACAALQPITPRASTTLFSELLYLILQALAHMLLQQEESTLPWELSWVSQSVR